MTPFNTQTYLLASLYQCAEMIHHIATTGKCSYQNYKAIITALNVEQFHSIEEAFAMPENLNSGLIACDKYLSMQVPQTEYSAMMQINRYLAEFFKLSSTLKKQPHLMGEIAEQVSLLRHYFDNVDEHMETLIKSFATIYTEKISPNAAKVLIRGTENHLQTEFNAQKVRALLLAGLRIVWLWREAGGKQWHLFLRRKKIIDTCKQLQKQ